MKLKDYVIGNIEAKLTPNLGLISLFFFIHGSRPNWIRFGFMKSFKNYVELYSLAFFFTFSLLLYILSFKFKFRGSFDFFAVLGLFLASNEAQQIFVVYSYKPATFTFYVSLNSAFEFCAGLGIFRM